MSLKIHLQQLFELNEEEVNQITNCFVEERLPKNASFVEEGRACKRLSFITSGIMRVSKETATQQVTQWIGTTGYFVTDLASFLFKKPANYTITALTEVQLFSIYQDDYNQLENTIPMWNQIEKRFIAKCFMQIEERVFDFISLSAEERYQKYFNQHKALFHQVPLHYIASVLGMTPETLSRIRAKSTS